MSNRQKLMGHLYAIFTTLVWGSCFVLTKVMLTAYTPTQIIPCGWGWRIWLYGRCDPRP